MDATIQYLNGLYNKAKKEFGDLNWIGPYSTDLYTKQRQELLENLKSTQLFKQTKPFYKQISKGCQLCGEGQWNCLFVASRCNANCFYCPTEQNLNDPPGTQGLNFHTPKSYADYVNHFGYRGVSFSGGEPLLEKERVLSYLKEVKKRCSPEIYTWMYTNGILASKKSFQQLADAGLDEIRFDIGAVNYNLDAIKLAQNIIPNITIEIPAVPEKTELLKHLLPQMNNLGVTNLNLHQMRLTNYNAPQMLKRDYTYIAAERPIVLESELSALKIMQFAREQQANIGINYCSFFFKNRFQQAGFRKKLALKLGININNISEQGYIRELRKNEITYSWYKLHEQESNCMETINLEGRTYGVGKHTAFRHVEHNPKKMQQIVDLLQSEPVLIPSDALLFEIYRYEYIESGLRDY